MSDRRLVRIDPLHTPWKLRARIHFPSLQAKALPGKDGRLLPDKWCAGSRILSTLILLAMSPRASLTQVTVPPQANDITGDTSRTTVVIDYSRPIATFSPSAALGAGVDGH